MMKALAVVLLASSVSAEKVLQGSFKCIDKWKRCTDRWCMDNCNHNPSYCPRSYCRGAAVPAPPPAPPAPKPDPLEKCPDDSILGTSWFDENNENVHKAYKLVCCPSSCGDCAGDSCAKRPGGAKNCCGRTITVNQTKCGSAPCVLGDPPPADAAVVDVAEVSQGNFVCIDKWKRCTDRWCMDNCNHNPSYCPRSYCRGAAVPAPPPAPPAPKPDPLEKCPDDSILGTSWFDEKNENVHKAYKLVCCPSSCGDCAGDSCATRPGGAKNCCGRTITVNQTKCGSAPCVLGDPPPADAAVFELVV